MPHRFHEFQAIHRHIGGLEISAKQKAALKKIHRHTGGLEIAY